VYIAPGGGTGMEESSVAEAATGAAGFVGVWVVELEGDGELAHPVAARNTAKTKPK
jgi:hypothetical protein